jgi:hypothetical protein
MNDGDRPANDLTLETVGAYPTIVEASIVRGRLEQAGIRCWLQGELASGQLFQVGTLLGGIKLEVASDDLQRVRDLLAEDAGGEQNSPWTCSHCNSEVDAGFAVCWNCQEPATGG